MFFFWRTETKKTKEQPYSATLGALTMHYYRLFNWKLQHTVHVHILHMEAAYTKPCTILR
jgi:hypothetical protein